MCQNYQMSVSGKNIRIFNKVAMVILEIKKDQFWCGKAFGRRLMTWDCTYVLYITYVCTVHCKWLYVPYQWLCLDKAGCQKGPDGMSRAVGVEVIFFWLLASVQTPIYD